MKVALIENFPPTSGPGAYTYSLYAYLNRQNVQADLILLNPFKGFERVGKGKIIVINRRSSKLNFIKNYLVNPHKVPKGYDIYHITNEWIGTYAKYNRPSIVTFHDPFQKGPGSEYAKALPSSPRLFTRKFEWSKIYHFFADRSKEASRYANMIICISGFVLKNVKAVLRLDETRFRVIPHGLDLNVFKLRDKNSVRKMLNLPLRRRIILAIGNESTPIENHLRIISAFAIVKRTIKDGILLRVGQRNPSFEAYKLIKELGLKLGEDVIYVGRVPYDRMPFYYNASDVLASPSLYESFGRCTVEAMASGCPVVASTHGALPEVVGDAGLLVNPYSASEIASAIERVLSDNNLRENLIKRGLLRAKKFSIEVVGREILGLYEEVVNYVTTRP